MKLVLSTIVVASFMLCVHVGLGQEAKKDHNEIRKFELTAVAPPTPPLEYQLLFDNMADRRPGNAAILYLQAALMMESDWGEKADKALEAYYAKDMAKFRELGPAIGKPSLFTQLDVAGRREQCDWQPPFRELGIETMLPHLNGLRNVMKLVQVKALSEIEQGKATDALKTLRLGYEMSDKVGTEPILISAMVSLAMTRNMNDCLAGLMNRPESPNLYWALSQYPARQPMYRRALDGERGWVIPSIPTLAKVNAGGEPTVEEWREALDYIARLVRSTPDSKGPDPIKDTSPAILKRAQQRYAQSHQISAEQAAKVDPAIVLGGFYFEQYLIASEGMFQARGLPYPLQLRKSKEHDTRLAQLAAEQPANPFFQAVANVHGIIVRFANVDRQLAALTAVEAIRSYAAANGGKLPQRLEDITETPVPTNPTTGQPFEYRLDKDTATLSDSKSDDALTYTISIRK